MNSVLKAIAVALALLLALGCPNRVASTKVGDAKVVTSIVRYEGEKTESRPMNGRFGSRIETYARPDWPAECETKIFRNGELVESIKHRQTDRAAAVEYHNGVVDSLRQRVSGDKIP